MPQLDVGSCVGEIFGGAAYATWIYLDHAGLGLKKCSTYLGFKHLGVKAGRQ